MSDVIAKLAKEASDKAMEIARLKAENDRLREQGARLFDKTLELGTENAKLRSICAEVAGILFNLDVDYCGLCDRDSINHPCPVHTVKGGECLIESELREMGVEVGE